MQPHSPRSGSSDHVLTGADRVWNRAALERGGARPADGDRALAALLAVHGVAMNGGLVHAIELFERDEVEGAVAGYVYFGLDDAAGVVRGARDRVELADPDGLDALEGEADDRYAAAIPSDAHIAAAFEERFRERPSAFAPLEQRPR